MVGRILGHLARRGVLREPAGRRISVRKRLWRRPHAVRLPLDWPIQRPGDLVELDTLDIRPPGLTHPLKQFTARDRVSRWDTVELRRNALARTAASVLDALEARMPFPVRAISVDNGSEFMAEFEAACAERSIRLFVLPPRSPKLHGSVERANRTHTEEFYEVTDAPSELEALAAELACGRSPTTRSGPTRLSGSSHRPSSWPRWSRCVTEVPNEYMPLARSAPLLPCASVSHPFRAAPRRSFRS